MLQLEKFYLVLLSLFKLSNYVKFSKKLAKYLLKQW